VKRGSVRVLVRGSVLVVPAAVIALAIAGPSGGFALPAPTVASAASCRSSCASGTITSSGTYTYTSVETFYDYTGPVPIPAGTEVDEVLTWTGTLHWQSTWALSYHGGADFDLALQSSSATGTYQETYEDPNGSDSGTLCSESFSDPTAAAAVELTGLDTSRSLYAGAVEDAQVPTDSAGCMNASFGPFLAPSDGQGGFSKNYAAGPMPDPGSTSLPMNSTGHASQDYQADGGTDNGDYNWTTDDSVSGNTTVGGACEAPSRKVTGSSRVAGDQTDPCCPTALSLKAGPRYDLVENKKYKLSADASGGCRPYTFLWKLYSKPKLAVVSAGSQTAKGASSSLPVTISCPRKNRPRSPESWHPCWGGIYYQVTVTDAQKQSKPDLVGFDWEGRCSSKSQKNLARSKLDDEATEIWDDLKHHGIEGVALKVVERVVEGEELAPALLANDLARAGIDLAKVHMQYDAWRAQLHDPNC